MSDRVYLVSRGSWDSFCHEAAFSTREKAQAYIDESKALDAERDLYEWERINSDVSVWYLDPEVPRD